MAEDNNIPISARLLYGAITSEDLFQLRSFRTIVKPHLESILDEFYAHVSKDGQAAAIFVDKNHQQRAKAAQLSHWCDRVFSGKFDDSYVGAVTRIGLAHLRAGVDLRLYIGGYSFILNKLTRILLAQFPNDTMPFDAMYSAVQKAVFLDMEIASSVYADQSMKLFKELSLTDQLTNIPNRRAIEGTGLKTFSEAQRYAHPLTIAILDLDKFKHVNDTYGHAAGDAVLCGVAQCLQSGLRISDIYGRWGGEEFLILLPSTKLQAAKRPLDRLLDLIRNTPFRINHNDIHATASIGIAEISKTDDTFEALVSRADVALYEAKTAGRDRVMAA